MPDTMTGTYGTTPGTPYNYDYAALSANINELNRQYQNMANLARVPGAPGLEAQSSKVIGQKLLGELPEDVITQIGQGAAERGVATGLYGSPNVNAQYLRALGLTSAQMQEEGERDLTAAYARNPAAPLFDIGTQLISPLQQEQLNLEQQRLEQQRTLAEKQMEQQAALERERLAIEAQRNALSGRGGGGPSRQPTVPETATGTSLPTWADIFGAGGRYGTTPAATVDPWQNWWKTYGGTSMQTSNFPAESGQTMVDDLGSTWVNTGGVWQNQTTGEAYDAKTGQQLWEIPSEVAGSTFSTTPPAEETPAQEPSYLTDAEANFLYYGGDYPEGT